VDGFQTTCDPRGTGTTRYLRGTVIDSGAKTWLRADAGGLAEMHHGRGSLVDEGDRICTITNPFKTDTTVVEAPFTGLVVGILENPLVYPGNPICHLVALDDVTMRALRANQTGERA